MKVSQPTVTFHLNKLQEQLGVPLFVSASNRTIKLTDMGESFYHYAKQIVGMEDEISDMIEGFRGLHRGKLAIGATYTPATYILPEYLELFNEQYPEVQISLEVNTASVLLAMLRNYELDLAILPHYHIDDSDLHVSPLVKDDLTLIFSPTHPLAQLEHLRLNDLQGLPMIMHEKKSISRKLIDQWAEEHAISLKEVIVVSATETMKELVKRQLGVAIISEKSCARELGSGDLLGRPLPSFHYERNIYLVSKKDKLPSPTFKAFLDCTRQVTISKDRI
jgi:DNA-binding transcriptional LysR family regulator